MKVLVVGGTRPGHFALKSKDCKLVCFIEINEALPSDVTFGYESLHYFKKVVIGLWVESCLFSLWPALRDAVTVQS